MRVKILSQFGYQTYPQTDDMIDLSESDLKAVKQRTKCFNAEKTGVIDYTPPAPTDEQIQAQYKTAVIAKIRKQYTVDDELAILRQQTEKPEEYQAYFTYCEQCKAEVKEKIGGAKM